MADDPTDKVQLAACPFCDDPLMITGAGMAVHVEQGNCIIGQLGFPADHPPSVARWNTRSRDIKASAGHAALLAAYENAAGRAVDWANGDAKPEGCGVWEHVMAGFKEQGES